MRQLVRIRIPFPDQAVLAALMLCAFAGCTKIEYETTYFTDRSFSPRSNMPRVVDQPELALRDAGYVDIGALLVRGNGARIKVIREAARLGADLIYLTYFSGPQSRIVSSEEDGEIEAKREAYYETYFEAKLFRLEPDLALDRGFLFALAFPSGQLDAGNYLVTPEMRLYYVKEFLGKGADPNMLRAGDPVIYCAVRYWRDNYDNRFSGIVRLLLEAGADPDMPSSSGTTARSYAEEMVRALEQAGADSPPAGRKPQRRVETLDQYRKICDMFREFAPAD